jgi:integrase
MPLVLVQKVHGLDAIVEASSKAGNSRRLPKALVRSRGVIPEDAGLHCFRHGLATELAERSVPVTVLQQQMRHADVRTTLRVYAHAIPQSQRDAMESIGQGSIGTNVPIGTKPAA